MKTSSISRRLFLSLSLVGMVALASCGGSTISSSGPASNTTSSSGGKTSAGGFSFIPQRTSSTSGGTSSTSTGPSSIVLDIDVLADINADGDYKVEAEDCDTAGCTLQAGCAGFYEYPEDIYPTSGGECIACIASPSILAFQFNVQQECDITFYTVCSKYENPWALDANVQYYIDEDGTPFVTNYTDFGHTEENMWYNWKTVELGTLHVAAGVHQFNIKVVGAFPNTDYFSLVVSNYGQPETPDPVEPDPGTSSDPAPVTSDSGTDQEPEDSSETEPGA